MNGQEIQRRISNECRKQCNAYILTKHDKKTLYDLSEKQANPYIFKVVGYEHIFIEYLEDNQTLLHDLKNRKVYRSFFHSYYGVSMAVMPNGRGMLYETSVYKTNPIERGFIND